MEAEAILDARRAASRAALASGYDGVPWPEFWRGRPALVVPQLPDAPRPLKSDQGWSGAPAGSATLPHPGWSLDLDGRQITITGPAGAWFRGHPLLTRDWRRAARAQRTVVLISGPFAHINEFAAVAVAGALQLLPVAVRSAA